MSLRQRVKDAITSASGTRTGAAAARAVLDPESAGVGKALVSARRVPKLDARVPEGDALTAWDRRRAEYRLVNPANRRKYTVIVVGTGLAGSGAAAALAELGYHVECFTFHDAPRRAHSVAAQGGINAARARKIDGDSLRRFITCLLYTSPSPRDS